MFDFLAPVWDQTRPTEAQIEEMWTNNDISCDESLSNSLARLKDVISARAAHGKTAIAECILPQDAVLHFFVSRNRVVEADFFSKIFSQTSVLSTLGSDLASKESTDSIAPKSPAANRVEKSAEGATITLQHPILLRDSLGFELTNTFSAIGGLASTIFSGGPYYKPSAGDDIAAMDLALEVANSAFDRRFGEALAYVSYEPWADWFEGIAWDSSWAFIDKRARKMTLILITDTD